MTDRAAIVDDLICDLITALSLKRNQGKDRQIIEYYTQAIVQYCDDARWQEHRVTTTAGIVKLEMEATR